MIDKEKPFRLEEALAWKDRGHIPYQRFLEIRVADRKRIEELEERLEDCKRG